MSFVYRILTYIIVLNLSINLVNITGVFPVRVDMPLHQAEINKTITDIQNQFKESTSTLDYLTASAFTLINGIKLFFAFVFSLFTGFDNFLESIGLPHTVAFLIGNTINLLTILGVAHILMGRR